MNNSIINSLKRLERVGSETSRVTQKLKISVIEIAKKILHATSKFRIEKDSEYLVFTRIAKKLYILDFGNNCCLVYDWNGNCKFNNYKKYIIDEEDPTRVCCLYFAKAVAEGLLDDVAEWIEKKRIEADIAKEQITSSEKNLIF